VGLFVFVLCGVVEISPVETEKLHREICEGLCSKFSELEYAKHVVLDSDETAD
jgi:hypothetical protein